MSDSELSDAPNAPPDDATLESELRRVVRDAIKSGDEITVRIARTQAEEHLGLDANFFKQDAWKERSKDIISAAVDEPDSPVKAKPKAAGRKRKSEEPTEKPKKRARKSSVIESEDDEEEEDIAMNEDEDDEEEEDSPKPKAESKSKAKPAPKPKAKPKSKPKAKAASPVVESDEDDDEEAGAKNKSKNQTIDSDDEAETKSKQPATREDVKSEPLKPADEADKDNDSDMSILIDDPPPKKKASRQKKSTSPSSSSKPSKKSTTSASKDLSPDEEEIKRLQSWLLKCGIRKLWHRELAPYDTPKAKVSHLKSMLSDAGMTGRFSVEKAKSIKEARELKEELEAAKDFEEKFGTGGRGRRSKKNVSLKEQGSDDDEEEEDNDGGDAEEGDEAQGAKRPGGRLLPKGLVDFGDSGDDGSD